MWLDIYMRDKLGEERWAEEKESEMRGVDYVLGFREMKEMEGTKRFLERVWKKRGGEV